MAFAIQSLALPATDTFGLKSDYPECTTYSALFLPSAICEPVFDLLSGPNPEYHPIWITENPLLRRQLGNVSRRGKRQL
jgi:hypothetical protein